jgi:hypothetical protein
VVVLEHPASLVDSTEPYACGWWDGTNEPRQRPQPDSEIASESFAELLAQLAGDDPRRWLDAFERLPHSEIGTWAGSDPRATRAVELLVERARFEPDPWLLHALGVAIVDEFHESFAPVALALIERPEPAARLHGYLILRESDCWPRVRALFRRHLQRETDPTLRAAMATRSALGDAGLVAEVDRLIDAHEPFLAEVLDTESFWGIAIDERLLRRWARELHRLPLWLALDLQGEMLRTSDIAWVRVQAGRRALHPMLVAQFVDRAVPWRLSANEGAHLARDLADHPHSRVRAAGQRIVAYREGLNRPERWTGLVSRTSRLGMSEARRVLADPSEPAQRRGQALGRLLLERPDWVDVDVDDASFMPIARAVLETAGIPIWSGNREDTFYDVDLLPPPGADSFRCLQHRGAVTRSTRVRGFATGDVVARNHDGERKWLAIESDLDEPCWVPADEVTWRDPTVDALEPLDDGTVELDLAFVTVEGDAPFWSLVDAGLVDVFDDAHGFVGIRFDEALVENPRLGEAFAASPSLARSPLGEWSRRQGQTWALLNGDSELFTD